MTLPSSDLNLAHLGTRARRTGFLVVVLLSTAFSALFAANDLYWDANGTVANTGTTATGTWGTSNFWNTSSTGTGGTLQTSTANTNDVHFSSGTNYTGTFTVTISGAQSANSIAFEEGTLTLSGGTSITLGGAGVGSPGITKTTANATTISTALILGESQTWTNNAAGLLTVGAVNAATGSGNTFTLSITNTGAGGLTIGGVIGDDTSGTNKTALSINTSAGKTTISGNNTFSGGTTLTAGTVFIGNSNALGSGGLAINGGTLELRGNNLTLASLSGSGGTITNANVNTATTLTVGSDNTSTTFGGTFVDGTGNRVVRLTKTGTGVLTLSGANSQTNFNDGTTISGGVLRLNNANALLGGTLTINGGVLELQNPSSFTRNLGNATNTGNQVQITGGASGFSAFGSTATINLNNNASTIQWGSATFNPTTFILNGTTATAALNFQNGLDLNGANRTINVNANTATINGAIVNNTGTAGLVKGGAGTLVLNNANTYNGATTINAGTLKIDNNNTTTARLANTSGITVASGGTLLLAQSGLTSSTDRIGNSVPVTLNGGAIFNSGGLTEGIAPTGPLAANGSPGMGALTLTLSAQTTIVTIDFAAPGSTFSTRSVKT